MINIETPDVILDIKEFEVIDTKLYREAEPFCSPLTVKLVVTIVNNCVIARELGSSFVNPRLYSVGFAGAIFTFSTRHCNKVSCRINDSIH